MSKLSYYNATSLGHSMRLLEFYEEFHVWCIEVPKPYLEDHGT